MQIGRIRQAKIAKGCISIKKSRTICSDAATYSTVRGELVLSFAVSTENRVQRMFQKVPHDQTVGPASGSIDFDSQIHRKP